MCPGARVAALSSVLQYLAQEKLSALVLRIFEELLGLIILDDLVRVDKEYPLKCIVQAVDGQCNRELRTATAITRSSCSPAPFCRTAKHAETEYATVGSDG